MDVAIKNHRAGGVKSQNACSHGELYRKSALRVERICLAYSNDPMEAADLCHEVFVKVFLNWSSFRGESQPMTWVTAITRNVCLTHIKRKKYRSMRVMDFVRETDAKMEFDVDQRYQARILLKRTLSKANHSRHAILSCYFGEDWNQAEIAAKLGVSRVAVTRALTRVRKEWNEESEADTPRKYIK